MTTLGLIYSAAEYTINGKSTGGHDALRSMADKTYARTMNTARLGHCVIDVGSKYRTFHKIMRFKEHYTTMQFNP